MWALAQRSGSCRHPTVDQSSTLRSEEDMRGISYQSLLLVAALGTLTAAAPLQRPSIAYTIRFDEASLDIVHVELRLENVPRSFALAMKVHAEYDAKYWRFLDSLRVD